MSFIKRAQEAAAAAAEQAQQAAGLASKSAADPATQEKLGQLARAAMGAARRLDSGGANRSRGPGGPHHQVDGSSGDDERLIAREAVPVPDIRGQHHRL